MPPPPTRAAAGGGTRTPTSSSRRSSRSPTAWAAPRPARSPRGSRPRRSGTPARTARRGRGRRAHPGGEPARLRARRRATRPVAGMGTTMTAALVEGDTVRIGHVGDSRAYRVRDGALEQLTDDHSLVAELVRSGRLSPEEADVHPQRSVITRVLGTDPEVDVDTFDGRGAPRGRLHDLLGRPDVDGRRRVDPRRRRAATARASTGRRGRSSTPRTRAAARTTSP